MRNFHCHRPGIFKKFSFTGVSVFASGRHHFLDFGICVQSFLAWRFLKEWHILGRYLQIVHCLFSDKIGVLQNHRPRAGHRQVNDHRPPTTDPLTYRQVFHRPTDHRLPTHRQVFHRPTDHRPLTHRQPTTNPSTSPPPAHRPPITDSSTGPPPTHRSPNHQLTDPILIDQQPFVLFSR